MIQALGRPILQCVLRDRPIRLIGLTITYALAIGLGMIFAYLLRFDFDIPLWIRASLLPVCIITVAVHLLCMFLFHQFDGLLSYFSTPDLRRLMLACTTAVFVLGAIRLTLGTGFAPPKGGCSSCTIS